MRARKEERNKAMWNDWKSGMMQKDVAKKYGLCRARTCTILHNQDRWEAVEANRNNMPKRMSHDEMIRYIEEHRRK